MHTETMTRPEAKARDVPIMASEKLFLLSVSIPPVRPNANPRRANTPMKSIAGLESKLEAKMPATPARKQIHDAMMHKTPPAVGNPVFLPIALIWTPQ